MPPQIPQAKILIENAGQLGVLVSSGLSIFIPTLLVTLRFVAKRTTARLLDASDYCILVALLFNVGLHVDCWLMVYRGGFGYHVSEIVVRFGFDTLTVFFKGIMGFAMLWNAAICFSKLSVLLMYSTLIPVRRLILPARVLGITIVLWNTSEVVAGLTMCQPIARNWDTSITEGFCGDKVKYYMWLGIVNVITDVLMLALPLPFLYQLNMKLHKRIILLAMFSVGFLTCGITIYRQTMLPTLDFADMPYSGLIATIFSGLEPAVAISLACVPFIRPIFSKMNAGQLSSYTDSEGAGSRHRSKNNRSGTEPPFEELADDFSDIMQLRPTKHGRASWTMVQDDNSESGQRRTTRDKAVTECKPCEVISDHSR